MSLKHSYRLLAPIYDVLIAGATEPLRKQSLATLASMPRQRVLVSGAGTGLDFPYLSSQHEYVALELTAAMQARARARATGLNLTQVRGDCMALPFPDASFDCVVLHLILAVVPEPQRCLAETARVLRPGGRIVLLDKFLRPGQRAPLRRMLSPLSSQLATRMDVVFEEVLRVAPELQVVTDKPALMRGWFRSIVLEKKK